MFENIKSILTGWNSSKNQRQKLQHTYLVIAIVMVFVAGMVSLVNPDVGQQLVKLAVFAVIAFLVNAIVWNLLDASLLSKLTKKTRRK